MTSKTIVITGSTDGIGLLTAKKLTAQGHNVVLHGRSAAKLEAAVAEVGRAEVGGDVLRFQADLSSLEETAALADAIRSKLDRIDVLINNAGVLKAAHPILPNGQDLRFVVNTLAPYVLTQALLPMIPADGRILNLSSAAQAPVSLEAMKGDAMGAAQRLDDMGAYAQSKRAITLWSQQLAETLPQGPVVLAVNPGSLLASKMVKEGFGIAGHDLNIGADILCRLALDAAFADASGQYWDNDAGGFAAVDPAQGPAVVAAIKALTR